MYIYREISLIPIDVGEGGGRFWGISHVTSVRGEADRHYHHSVFVRLLSDLSSELSGHSGLSFTAEPCSRPVFHLSLTHFNIINRQFSCEAGNFPRRTSGVKSRGTHEHIYRKLEVAVLWLESHTSHTCICGSDHPSSIGGYILPTTPVDWVPSVGFPGNIIPM